MFLKVAVLVLIYLGVAAGAVVLAFPEIKTANGENETPQIFAYSVSEVKSQKVPAREIPVVIVPHHLVADRQIAEALAYVAEARRSLPTRRIILMGPNHFFRGEGQVITDSRAWETNYGEVAPDRDFIKNLRTKNFASEEEGIIAGDHAVTALLPFVEKFFPDALFVPLLVREPISQRNAKSFGEFLARTVAEDTLVIASIDFAHYVTKAVADEYDKASIAAIAALDLDFFEKQIQADGRQILMILANFLKKTGHTKFTLLGHTNSAELMGNLAEPSTTSHIMGIIE